jgi:hypothetical protein
MCIECKSARDAGSSSGGWNGRGVALAADENQHSETLLSLPIRATVGAKENSCEKRHVFQRRDVFQMGVGMIKSTSRIALHRIRSDDR